MTIPRHPGEIPGVCAEFGFRIEVHGYYLSIPEDLQVVRDTWERV
jgi:hypothetical protein